MLVDGRDRNETAAAGEVYENQPKISPDGRWMAYTSNESGKDEVYVRPFPEVNKGKWQVSTSGGTTRYGRRMAGSCSIAVVIP